MKTLLLASFLLALTPQIFAQIGINPTNGNPHTSAMLDVQSTDKGMLIPRMSSTQRNNINSPATGLLVFDNDLQTFWFYNGSQWEELLSGKEAIPDTALPIPIKYHGAEIIVHPTDNGSNIDWTTAQSICNNLIAFGFNDWYLPNRLELDAMHKQAYLITGLSQSSSSKYWSNTEHNLTHAITQRLDYGGPDPDDKTVNTDHNCRCVRKN